jgi:hypothetical protein
MIVEQLRGVLGAKPFRPFEIYLADGRSLKVPHPEFLAPSPAGRTVIVFFSDGGFEVVDLLLVTSLKVRANGSPRSKSSR